MSKALNISLFSIESSNLPIPFFAIFLDFTAFWEEPDPTFVSLVEAWPIRLSKVPFSGKNIDDTVTKSLLSGAFRSVDRRTRIHVKHCERVGLPATALLHEDGNVLRTCAVSCCEMGDAV